MRRALSPLVVSAAVVADGAQAQPGAAAGALRPGERYFHTRGTRLVGPDGQPAVLRGMGR